jgi:hypothetical protein
VRDAFKFPTVAFLSFGSRSIVSNLGNLSNLITKHVTFVVFIRLLQQLPDQLSGHFGTCFSGPPVAYFRLLVLSLCAPTVFVDIVLT